MVSSALRVGILGPVEVWDGPGPAVPLPPQLRRLLALLVTADGASVSAERISAHITDGHLDGSVIRTAMSRLRRILGDRIETTTAGYRLRVRPGELDSERFRALLNEAHTRASSSRATALNDALGLWRGPALEGLADEPWAVATATALDEARASAIEDLGETLLDLGRAAEAITLLVEFVAEHPYRERPVALLMRALAVSGRLTEALRAYQRLRLSLHDDVGIEPSASLRAVEAELLVAADPGERDPTVTARAWAARPMRGNPHRPAQSFVGRVRELKDLVVALRSRRLITLAGVGGAGKTRLALELLSASAVDVPSGVCVVELAAVADRDAVLHSAMTVLGAVSESGRSRLDSIVDVLRDQHALVVIDNCEHVLDAARELVTAILGGCDQVSIVATSREPLNVACEQVHIVSPLDAFESFDLFCERAREADDRFDYDDGGRAVIEAICARLDGLPLAIELAAARTRALTTHDVLERIDNRFALLRAGRAASRTTGSGRHVTLHAAIDWSYQLLDDTERAVFERAGVFAGGFDLDAAVAVCAPDRATPVDVESIVASLVDKSMIVADRCEHVTRYWLLETLRQFALDRLAERGADTGVRERHVTHYDGVAADIKRTTRVDQQRALVIAEREWDNLRAALYWAVGTGDHDHAASIAACLSIALSVCRDEHQRWIAAVLDVLPDEHRLAALLHCLAGWWANLLGDHQEALRCADHGLTLATHTREQILLKTVVTEAHVHLGRPADALASAQELMALSPLDRDVRHGLMLACWSAWSYRPELVSGYADRLAAVARETGLQEDVHQAAYAAGIVALINDDPARAIGHFRESLDCVKGLRGLEGEALQGLTLAAAAANDADTAATFVEALEVLSAERAWAHLWMVLEGLAIHWADTARLVDAATLLGGLSANGRGSVFLVAGRSRAQTAIDADPDLGPATHRGRSMTRAQLVKHALANLTVARDQPDPKATANATTPASAL